MLYLFLFLFPLVNGNELRGTRRLGMHFLDPKSVTSKDDVVNRRKFVEYISSPWEQMWLDHVDEWAEHKDICNVLNSEPHKSYMHDFLNLTCTNRFNKEWCVLDDEYRPLYYNSANRDTFELSWEIPPELANVQLGDPPQPYQPTAQHEHILSKFIFEDEANENERYVEYIEPLVSHLRFPLCKCATFQPNDDRHHWWQITFKGWILPPQNLRTERNFFFDAGASDWNQGAGGPSLKYFYNMWKRHDIQFDQIYAYELTTPREDFYKTVPPEFVSFVHYQQCAVSSSPADEDPEKSPFLPHVIQRETKFADYVLFKLDIDSPKVEDGTIDYIIQHSNNNEITEVVWEHHIAGNYLMSEWGPAQHLAPYTLRQSYELFLQMRQKGIRAHSWI